MTQKEAASLASNKVPVENGAEAFVELLNANGVSYIFVNPGSDIFPILEAVSKFKVLGKPSPELVLCLHESLAMTAAQGYFMVSERVQVVLVHTDVGTQQVGGALHNAQRGMAGMLFCAGCTPWTFEGERAGSRDLVGQFRQEQFDQASVVRAYVKWAYELRCNDNIHHVVQRGFQVANTEPHGPVYLILPRELLMEKMSAVPLLPKNRYGAAISPEADEAVLAEVARLLIAARNPLVIACYLGRHPEAVAPFVELAEALALRVISVGMTMNFPTVHPLWGGISPNPYLREADVILIIDSQTPYVPVEVQPASKAKIIYIDIDPVKASYPTWNFPADIRVEADSSKAIPALNQLVSQLLSSRDKIRIQERFERLKREHETQRAQWKNNALARAQQCPISPEWLAYCVAQEIDDDTIVFDEGVTNWPAVAHHLRRSKPNTLFRAGGSNLGWGLGCALGAKLAAPKTTVVCLTGDGSFLFGHPTAALWAARNHDAPFLTIIFDNEGYWAVSGLIRETYGKESYSARSGNLGATVFKPPPDYAQLAKASGAWGEVVEDPSLLPGIIKGALERVRAGQSVVLDVKLERPWESG